MYHFEHTQALARRKHHIAMICVNSLLNDARVLKTASSIRKAGYRVTLFGIQPKESLEQVELIRGFNFEVVRLRNPGFALKKIGKWNSKVKDHHAFSLEFASYVNEFAAERNFTALYSHDMYGLAVGGRLHSSGPLSRLPWLHDVHEFVEGLTELPADLRDYVYSQEKKYIRDIDKISTVSPALQQHLIEKYGLDQCEFVPNCPRFGDFDTNYKDVLSDLNLDGVHGVKLLTYHGSVKPVRAVDVLIRALEILPKNVHVAIVSDNKSAYVNELVELSEKIAKGRVHFLPYVPSHRVSSYIRSSFATVHTINSYPNSELALPNKLFESLHADVPFICPPLRAMKTFIEKYKCGEVADSDKPQDMAEAILRALQNKNMSEIKFPDETKRAFSWEMCEDRIISNMLDPLLLSTEAICVEHERTQCFMPKSVIHLPAFSAGQPNSLARSLKESRFNAKSAVLSKRNAFQYEADIYLTGGHKLKRQTNGKCQLINLKSFLSDNSEIKKQDIYHFHARSLLYQGDLSADYILADLAYFKLSGKRVFFHFRGSEARLKSVFKEKSPYSWFAELDSCVDEERKQALLLQCPYDFDEGGQTRFISRAKACSSEIFVTDPELGSYVPNATIVPRTVNAGLFNIGKNRIYKSDFDTSNPLRIAHAPSRPFIKGTAFLEKAIKEVEKEGYPISLDLIVGVPNSEAIERYSRADLIVDQLRIGWYGVFGVEAMALGVPVICYIRDDLTHYLPEKSPLLNANPNTISQVIKAVFDEPASIEEYGQRGYEYALRVHHPNKIAGLLERIYLDAWEPEKSYDDLREFSRVCKWLTTDGESRLSDNVYGSVGTSNEVSSLLLNGIRAERHKDRTLAHGYYKELADMGDPESAEVKYASSRIRFLLRT